MRSSGISNRTSKSSHSHPGGFPDSPQKASSSKARVVAPAGDPDSSSSSSSNSDDMSDHGGGAGGSVPEPVPELLPRLSIKGPSPKNFTGNGEDLKPEAFDGL